MNLLQHPKRAPKRARRFIQALLLALLLNLSGHMFLHLGDAVSAGGETHLTSQQEAKTVSLPQHQCSICQDHQHLSLEFPSLVALTDATITAHNTHQNEPLRSSLHVLYKSPRAPPRS